MFWIGITALPLPTSVIFTSSGWGRYMTGRKKKEYISAVQEGISRNYEPMEKIFLSVIRRTLRIRGHRQL